MVSSSPAMPCLPGARRQYSIGASSRLESRRRTGSSSASMGRTRGELLDEISVATNAVAARKSIPYFDVVHPLTQWQSPASIDLRQHDPVYGIVSAKQWPEAIKHDLSIDG